jgi:viroplasmin and RNaseH domain-containing protein
MAKSKKKNYYAVVHGACDPAPGIFSSWRVFTIPALELLLTSIIRALTHALTSGVSCPVFKGFGRIEEARAYMAQNGVTTYSEIIDLSQIDGKTSTSERSFHVVVHGRNIGVHSRY